MNHELSLPLLMQAGLSVPFSPDLSMLVTSPIKRRPTTDHTLPEHNYFFTLVIAVDGTQVTIRNGGDGHTRELAVERTPACLLPNYKLHLHGFII